MKCLKKVFVSIFVFILLLSSTSPFTGDLLANDLQLSGQPNVNRSHNNVVTGRYIIKFKSQKKSDEVLKGIKYNIISVKNLKRNNAYKSIIIDENISVDEFINEIKQKGHHTDIEYIQPDYELRTLSDDPFFSDQWGLENKGNSIVHANVVSSWSKSEGKNAVVAIIDTGIDIGHEDLKDNIWLNQNEILSNGIDDDKNGYVDDVTGWNFCDNSNIVYDKQAISNEIHGTEVAGIIAAVKNNKVGIAGVAPQASIIPIKVFNNGIAYTSDIINAIEYAESLGAKIANCSWGSVEYNHALKDAIESSNMLFVCASGNSHQNIDEYPVFPACFKLSNIISVASISRNGAISGFSNYGKSSVDVAAPGEGIFTTASGNTYRIDNGTSMAAAFVSGEAALIFGSGINNVQDIKDVIINTSDMYSTLLNKVKDGRKINCCNALNDIRNTTLTQIDLGESTNFSLPPSDATQGSTLYSGSISETLDPVSAYKKGIVPPFSVENDNFEDINPATGDMTNKHTDIYLKGRNNFDLNLNRYYSLFQANLYRQGQCVSTEYPQIGTQLHRSRRTYKQFNDGSTETINFETLEPITYSTHSEAQSEYQLYQSGYYDSTQGPYIDSSTGKEYNIIVHYQNLYLTGVYDYSDPQYVIYDSVMGLNENEARFDIGSGWAFDIPYIGTWGSSIYLHYGSAGIWKISNNDTSYWFEEDPNNDFTSITINGETYSNGQTNSYYAVTNNQGMKLYFGVYGQLIGMKDRFGNEIKYQYNLSDGWIGNYHLSKIIDSVGREVKFTYTSTQLKVDVIDPNDSTQNRTIYYNKTVIPNVPVYDSSTEYSLSSVVDAENRITQYGYDFKQTVFSFERRDLTGGGVYNYYSCLKTITHPTSALTKYEFVKSTKNCTNEGAMEFYKVSRRYDSNLDGIGYNDTRYYYKNNVDGTLGLEFDFYPYTYLPSGCSINSSVVFTPYTSINNKSDSASYIYNKDLLCTKIKRTSAWTGGSDIISETINEYDNTRKLLTRKTHRSFNASGQYITTIEDYEYHPLYRDVTSYYDSQAEGTKTTEHKTSYTYSSQYRLLTSKTYKKNANTTILEVYVPTTSGKSIELIKVKENGEIKKQTEYVYDSYGNIIEERKYLNNWADYISKKLFKSHISQSKHIVSPSIFNKYNSY